MAGNTAEALRRIHENKLTQSKILDLSGLGLTELPDELWDCVWVQELSLGHAYYWNDEEQVWKWVYGRTGIIANDLSSFPPAVSNLRHLTHLFLDGTRLGDLYPLSNLIYLKHINLSRTRLPNLVTLGHLSNLSFLDLSYTQVTDLSDLSTLSNLNSLNLSDTQVSDLDALSALSNLSFLDLSFTQVSDLSGLSTLSNLSSLNLRDTYSSDLRSLRPLINLSDLKLSSTEVSDLSVLAHLHNLSSLHLSYTQVSDLSALSALSNLSFLDLSDTQVSDLSALSALYNLSFLNLSNTQISDLSALRHLLNLSIIDLSSTELTDLTTLRHLQNLNSINLNKTHASDLSALSNLSNLSELYLSDTQASDLSALSALFNLNSLNLSYTQVSGLSALANLQNLSSLDLGDTEVFDLSPLANLQNLSSLDLSDTEVVDLSPMINLSKLKYLNLSSTPILHLPFELLFLPKLTKLDLRDTHCLNIPPELTHERNALPALRNYHTELQKDSYTSYDAKQILIGNGRVGKTSLLKTLYNLGDFDQNEDSTHGIQLFDSTLPLPEKQATAHLSLWDFGGQELYHATHRIFMKTRALYLVVWDPETEAKPGEETIQLHGQDYTFRNYPLSYWLGNVRALSKDAKIILICNKCDDGKERFLPNLQELQAEYNIDSFISISAKTGYGISTLRQRIQYLLNQMPEMGLQMPVSWRSVKEKLTTIRTQKPYIHIDEYHTVAATEDLSPGSMDTLLNFLHHSGFLFWNVHHIKDHPILDQKWALEAIYQLLDRNGWYPLLKGNALRRREELAKCWKAYSKEQIDLFLHMMSSCEIALELEDQEEENLTYLIPELLPDTPAPAVKDIWEAATGPTYHLRFQHPFFHAALIQRFIVRTAKLAERYDLLWRTGLLFKVDATMALVQVFPAQSRIEIQIRGKNPSDLVQRIKKEITSIQNVQSEALFHVSLSGLDNEWVSLDQLALQTEKGKHHIASTTGEILELAPFHPLLSSKHPDQDEGQEAPGLKELSDRESGLQLLIPTAPPNPLEGLKLLVKKELINEGIGAAITCLETHLHTNSTPATDLIVISSQFQAFNRNVAKGLHSVDEQYLLSNRISNQVVALLATIQERDLK
ncbi:COR domain-containing protein [Haliscomenobacter hydrossis]|nr:COR domain-containing protein [Haliscomenobacter hydrossis]